MGRVNDEMGGGCDVVAGLLDEETAGRVLTADEAALVARHAAACPDCDLERRAVAAMRIDGSTPLPRYLPDDIARRRWLDDIVAKSSAARPRAAGGRRVAILGALAAAAACAAVIVYSAADRPDAGGNGGPAAPIAARTAPATAAPSASAPAAPSSGAFLLGSDADAIGPGLAPARHVAAGDRITADPGPVAIALDSGIKLLLRNGGRIRIDELDSAGVEVRVDAGSILVDVAPKRPGPPLSVTTPAGSVGVKGTVFEVAVDGGDTRVGVLRGEVSLRANDGARGALGVGETAALDGRDRRALTEAESLRLQGDQHVLDILSDTESAAVIDIQSLPGGAEVSIDGVVLGATPITAAVRSGHRTVELAADGRAPVRELVELARGERLGRVFELEWLAPRPRAAGGSAAATTASEMLAAAQRLRSAREWAAAAAAYERLIAAYPSSTEARTSLISLGELRLVRLGAPAAALECYARYLNASANGSLAEEAAYGKARALRALGRETEERAALRAFLDGYPNALAAPQAAARLAAIGG